MDLLFVTVISYLIGAIPFGYLVGRYFGKDIRQFGSGNIGVTNVLRTFGKIPAALVLFLDAAKGYIPAYIGYNIGGENYAVIAGLIAMIGHSYPIYIGLKGGKGIATGTGIMLFLAPYITLIAFIAFVVAVTSSKYVSLGSLAAALTVSCLMFVFKKPLPYILFGLTASIFVIYRHRGNIKRLLNGTEYKIGQKVDS